MCHPSKVHLRNFWTWIQMILRIFCSNIKESFYLFPTEYAAFVDSRLLLIFWGLKLSLPLVLLLLATFPRRFVSCWLQIGELETLNRTCDFSSDLFRFFLTELDIWRIHLEELSRTSFLHAQQVYSVHCKLLSTFLKHWRLLTYSALSWWFQSFSLMPRGRLYT